MYAELVENKMLERLTEDECWSQMIERVAQLTLVG